MTRVLGWLKSAVFWGTVLAALPHALDKAAIFVVPPYALAVGQFVGLILVVMGFYDRKG